MKAEEQDEIEERPPEVDEAEKEKQKKIYEQLRKRVHKCLKMNQNPNTTIGM
ncbi:MAG: hypothetical protein K8S18_01075 [Desulfobacula sp.]|nr:hypothetical protein [Desulfobacula sp.]